MLASPAQEYPEFPATLAFLPVLNPNEAHRGSNGAFAANMPSDLRRYPSLHPRCGETTDCMLLPHRDWRAR